MIIGALRVKNEARWIDRAIRSLQPVCHRILVFDDHSTDGTPHFCQPFDKVYVTRSPFEGLDEARDKSFMMSAIIEPLWGKPWVLMIDGDEELVTRDQRVLEACAAQVGDRAPAYTTRVAFLWDREDQERVDGVYANLTRPSLFDLSRTSGVFDRTGSGGNFHCGNVPTDLRGKSRPSGAVLKHYGYLHRKDRIKKYEWYNRIDAENEAEDRYRHIVIGDLFPSDYRGKHGGPLELRAFPSPLPVIP